MSKTKKRRTVKRRRSAKPLTLTEAFFLLFIVIGIVAAIILLQNKGSYQIVAYDRSHRATLLHTADSLDEAQMLMQQEIERGTYNPAILQDDQMIDIRYGIIVFPNDVCTQTTAFTYLDQSKGYLNGCYGADALYVGYAEGWLFQISAAIGKISPDQAQLYDIHDPALAAINHYQVSAGRLLHYGSGNVKDSAKQFQIDLDAAPASLQDGIYYSYDGHYFYESFEAMADDVRAECHTNAVNSVPFYQYFQYLPQRSHTDHDETVLNAYLQEAYGITSLPTTCPADASASILYKSGSLFLDMQDRYTINALILFASAIHESDAGRSNIACAKHNLFGHSAYDDDPYASAAVYQSIAECLESHVQQYLIEGYANPADTRWHGSHLGDKANGMNVRYASDPYWGEKIASHLQRIDEAFGAEDSGKETILWVEAGTAFYTAPNEKVLYQTTTALPLIVVDQKTIGREIWYEVQSDAAIDPSSLVPDANSLYQEQEARVWVKAEQEE